MGYFFLKMLHFTEAAQEAAENPAERSPGENQMGR
jgi:hypothetical protein